MRTLRGCVLYEGLFTRRYFIYSGAYHTRVRTLCQCVFQPDAYLTWMRTSLFTYKLKIDQSKLTSLDSFSKQLILGFFNFDQSDSSQRKNDYIFSDPCKMALARKRALTLTMKNHLHKLKKTVLLRASKLKCLQNKSGCLASS